MFISIDWPASGCSSAANSRLMKGAPSAVDMPSAAPPLSRLRRGNTNLDPDPGDLKTVMLISSLWYSGLGYVKNIAGGVVSRLTPGASLTPA